MKQDELRKLAANGSRIDMIVAVIGEFTDDMHRPHCEAYEAAKYLSAHMPAGSEPLFAPDDDVYPLTPDKEDSLKNQFKTIRAALRENFSEEKVRFACQLIDMMRSGASGTDCSTTTASGVSKGVSVTGGASSSTSSDTSSSINDLYGKADGEQEISVLDMKVAIIGELSDDRHRGVPMALKMADEAEAQLKKRGLALYEPDDGEYDVDTVSPGKGSESEFKQLRAALRENFSREKLQRAIWLIRDLRDQGNPKFESRSESVSKASTRSTSSGRGSTTCEGTSRSRSETGGFNQSTSSNHSQQSTQGKGKKLVALIWSAVVVAIGVIVAAIIKFVK